METSQQEKVMSETEALREIIRNRDLTIKALKSHALCLRENFKTILTVIIDKFADSDIQFHARKMIEICDGNDLDKIGAGQ